MSARFAPVIKSRVAMSTAPRFVAFRSISSTANYQKGPIGVAKDTIKKADDLASNVALKGLNKGEKARDKIQETVHSTKSETESKAESMKGEAEKQAGKVKGEAEHTAGKVKGKTESAMGEAKGKAEEVKRSQLG
ncbi:hypothetical protein PENDEC_c005G02860 [Penicillium decumbens]|uniref:LEA domain protein n=1 Tax=Penicillium decumbens TaxID=69771 RepID=A0A1V6PGB7_PENDC|nr:hypothetical protein PENDEC_c005G02860 [Penicillium decumbens]